MRVAATELLCQSGTINSSWDELIVTPCQFSRIASISALIGLLLTIPILSARRAAAEEAADSVSVNPLRAGAMAVEFGVNPAFNYGSGAALSGKWHTGRSTAIRVGGAVAFQENKGDGSESDQNQLQNIYVVTDNHFEDRSYSAFAQLVQYLWIQNRMSLYLATGPIYRWSSEHSTNHGFGTDGSASLLRDDSSSWGAGLDLSIGFEWFFHHRLSLGARYGVSGVYGESSFDRTYALSSPDPNETFTHQESNDGKSFTISTDTTLLTLTAYF